MSKLLFFLLAFCCVVVCACKTADDGFDIYLLIGQSNCAGRGYMLEQDTTQTLDGVWLLNDHGEPEPAKAPLNRYSNIRKGLSWQMIGPGYSFGKAIHEMTGTIKIDDGACVRGGNLTSSYIVIDDYGVDKWIVELIPDKYL